jgi:hypothetical protein
VRLALSKSIPNWNDLNKNCLNKSAENFNLEGILENGLKLPDQIKDEFKKISDGTSSFPTKEVNNFTRIDWTVGNRISEIEPAFPGQTSLKSTGLNIRQTWLMITLFASFIINLN